MVLAGSFEFDRTYNSDIVERESDNYEVNDVSILLISCYF